MAALIPFLKTAGTALLGGIAANFFGGSRREVIREPLQDNSKYVEFGQKIDNLGQKLADNNIQLNEKQNEINNLQNSVSRKDQELEYCKRNEQRNEDKFEKLQKQNEEYKKIATEEKEEKNRVINKYNQEMIEKNNMIRILNENQDNLKGELQNVINENRVLSSQNEIKENELGKRNKENMELKENNEILNKKISILDEENKKINNSLNEEKRTNENLHKTIEETQKQLEKNEEEKRRKEKDNEEAQKQYSIEMKKTIDEKLMNEQKKISEEMIKYSETIKFELKQMKQFEKEIIKTKSNLLIEKCKKIVKNLKIEGEELKHFNILIIGQEGVGKSTLINAILNLQEGEKKAKVGVGSSVTEKFDFYESESLKGFRLWDSKGINKSYSLDKALENIKGFIKQKENNLDQAINCIWYCVAYDRYNKNELKDFLLQISAEYKKKIPFFILYLKAFDKKITEQMIKQINIIIDEVKKKDYLDQYELEALNNVEVIDIVSTTYTLNEVLESTIYPRNLIELLNKTIEKIDNAFSSTCYHLLTNKIKKIYKNDIKSIYNDNFKEEIKHDIIESVNDKSENLIYEELFSNGYHIFYDICKRFLGEELDKLEVDENIKTYFGNLQKNSKEYVENYIKEKSELVSENITNAIFDLQVTIDMKYNENMKNKKSKKQIYEDNYSRIKAIVSHKIQIKFLETYFVKLFDNIIDTFNDVLLKIYDEILDKNLNDEITNINNNIKNNFVQKLKNIILDNLPGYKNKITKKIKEEEKKIEEEINAKKKKEDDED